MTREDIIAKAKEILADEFEIDADLIVGEAPLKQTLGLDSLDLVDVVVLIDQAFGVTLKGPDFAGIVSFDDFFNMLEKKINA
ncbi:MAG: acyl carrier protein [Bacteroidales bacterium]|nr:acyl carrier protein [Bacteroidales bacterium]